MPTVVASQRQRRRRLTDPRPVRFPEETEYHIKEADVNSDDGYATRYHSSWRARIYSNLHPLCSQHHSARRQQEELA